MIQKVSIKISGMSCAACALRIEKGLARLSGIKTANVNFAIERAAVEFDDELANIQKIEEVVEKLGYSVIKEAKTNGNKAVLKITGMSCAACALKIEKKLNSLDGVNKANVNLTTEKATIEYDQSGVKTSELINTVKMLGYGAERAEGITRDREKEQREKEIKKLRNTLVFSIILASPLLLSMILSIFGLNISFLHNPYFQLAVATPIQFIIGFRFYKQAFYALKSKSTNMDVLSFYGNFRRLFLQFVQRIF